MAENDGGRDGHPLLLRSVVNVIRKDEEKGKRQRVLVLAVTVVKGYFKSPVFLPNL